ncbi:MAG: glycosyltransferase [Pseudomonadota bacterium]
MKIAFLCAHLSGTGHLIRILTLARAARKREHDVTVISGGRPLDHVDASDLDLVQLPPLIVRDLDFKSFWTAKGTQADQVYMADRRALLRLAVKGARPDILVTELYPFGRRALAKEFQAGINAAQRRNPYPQPKIVCSVRDVPEPKPKRASEVVQTLWDTFDAVLVHGDQDFLPLSATWPMMTPETIDLHHTGYLAGPMPLAVAHNPGVLVAVGGGPLGRHLLEVAAQAAGKSKRPWLLLVGGDDAHAVTADLTARHGRANLTVQPARPDYRALMASADCSISLCGYNTAVELTQCQTPAILVPEEGGGEQEQLIRARRLANHPGIRLLRSADLTPDTLAQAAEEAATAPRRASIPLRLDDGARAVTVLEELHAPAKAAR